MKLRKFLLGTCVLFLVNDVNAIFAPVVPFQNITLNPSAKLTANFAFGPHSIIFCFANDLRSVVNITWPYRGRLVSGQLPISLKTKANIDGQFSDAAGTLTLTNTPNNNGAAIVSCVFGF